VTDPLPRAGKRSQLELMRAQLDGVDAWLAAHRAARPAADRPGLTREARLDLSRRTEALAREHAAMVARTDLHLRRSGELIGVGLPIRAVLAHRNGWLRNKIAARLTEQGVAVVGSYDDGADAAGTVVAEQPDLALVEDRLPTLRGLDVVARARSFAPDTVVGVQVADSGSAPPVVDAGAHAVFTRRIPPAEMADRLLSCLGTRDRPLVYA
jgi:CheY-like chemotaxis protein